MTDTLINSLGGIGMEHGRSVKKRNASEPSGASAALRSVFVGSGIGVALSALLLFAATLAAYSCEDPDSLTGTLGIAVNFASAMAAGFCAVRINKGGALFCGALCGVLISCFFFFVHHMLTWLLVALPPPRAHYCSPLFCVSSVRPRDRVKPTFLSFCMGSGIK